MRRSLPRRRRDKQNRQPKPGSMAFSDTDLRNYLMNKYSENVLLILHFPKSAPRPLNICSSASLSPFEKEMKHSFSAGPRTFTILVR